MLDLSRMSCLAMALGTAVCLSGPAAARQLQFACDEDGDGLIDARESRLRTERRSTSSPPAGRR